MDSEPSALMGGPELQRSHSATRIFSEGLLIWLWVLPLKPGIEPSSEPVL